MDEPLVPEVPPVVEPEIALPSDPIQEAAEVVAEAAIQAQVLELRSMAEAIQAIQALSSTLETQITALNDGLAEVERLKLEAVTICETLKSQEVKEEKTKRDRPAWL